MPRSRIMTRTTIVGSEDAPKFVWGKRAPVDLQAGMLQSPHNAGFSPTIMSASNSSSSPSDIVHLFFRRVLICSNILRYSAIYLLSIFQHVTFRPPLPS